MKYLPATFHPVRNQNGPMVEPVLGLVVHVQEGDNSPWARFNDPATEVSSHFWVSKQGAVEQYVDTAVQAWAQAAGNAQYLSVETEGFDTEPFTTPQLAELIKLWEWVRTVYLLPNVTTDHGGRGLTTHAHYPSGAIDPAWGGHPCPGLLRASDLPTIVAAQRQPTPQEVPGMGVYLYAPTTQDDPSFVQVDGVVTQIVDTAVVAKYTAEKVGGCVVLPADHQMVAGLKIKAAGPS